MAEAEGQIAAPLLEESAEDLYENAPCGYLSTLPGGLIVRANQTFLGWTGYGRDQLVGRKRFQDVLAPGARIYHETHYAPLLMMQGSVREIAVDLLCADGRRLPALVNSVLRRDAAGNPLLVRTTVFDATDRKEYERELLRARQAAERADRAKARFISTVTHEIRTPLGTIMTVAHLLGGTELSPQQQKHVGMLRSAADGLLSLINQVLDSSRLDSGNVLLERRPFDLRDLVLRVVDMLRAQAQAKGLELVSDLDERLPGLLLGDPVKIGQVLTNLVGNAVKFTRQGSVAVTVSLRELGPQAVTVAFAVADTGIGIAPDRLSRIFEEFSQASYDVALEYGGTGLGLSISKRLVELHGSRLTVQSEPGRGSTFAFDLRLDIAPEPTPAIPAELA